MTIKLTISYDGTDFCGWQRQSKGISVQETIEDAIFKITGENVAVVGSGRTDAGVHAEGQVASFKTEKNIPPEKYAKALNTVLPNAVKILKSEIAPNDFNACRTAKKKTYRYSAYISDVVKPLKDRYKTQILERPKLNETAMKQVAELFLGEHDFKAFCASGSKVKSTIRTIYDIKINKKGEDLTFTITGNGFLYNMVRIMAGVIIAVGKGNFSIEQVKKMLAEKVRPMSVKTLPAKGLALVKVEY